MNNQFFIWGVILIGLAGTLYGSAKTNANLADANNNFASIGSYFKDNILLIVGCVLIYASIVAGVTLGDEVIEVNTGSLIGALITGSGIPATVKRWVLPLFGVEGDVAQKKLRDAIQTKANVADIANSGK